MDASVFVGPSPWMLWGNTQQITAQANAFTNPNANDVRITLNRIQYKRPESWHFLFAYRLLSGPNAPANQANVSVWFDLITGIGRAPLKIRFWLTMPSTDWSGGNFFQAFEWKNFTEKLVQTNPGAAPGSENFQTIPLEQIIGEDITVEANVSFTTDLPAPVQPVVVEVTGMWAPTHHARPDWFRFRAEGAEQFTGGEVKGR